MVAVRCGFCVLLWLTTLCLLANLSGLSCWFSCLSCCHCIGCTCEHHYSFDYKLCAYVFCLPVWYFIVTYLSVWLHSAVWRRLFVECCMFVCWYVYVCNLMNVCMLICECLFVRLDLLIYSLLLGAWYTHGSVLKWTAPSAQCVRHLTMWYPQSWGQS